MDIIKKSGINLKKWLKDEKKGLFFTADEESAALEALKICFSRINEGEKGVIAAPSFAEAEDLCSRLRIWASALEFQVKAEILPEGFWKGNPSAEDESPRAEILASALQDTPPAIFIASVHALLAAVPEPEKFRNSEIIIRRGNQISLSALAEKLVKLGYDDEAEATAVGEFSRRGGILDVYSPGMTLPVRIEFFGDEVDSLRTYSPSDGRSVRQVEECRIIVRSGLADPGAAALDFSAYVPNRFLLICRPAACLESLAKFGDDNALAGWELFRKKFSPEIMLNDLIESDLSGKNALRECIGVAPGLRVSAGENAGTAAELSRSLAAQFVREMLQKGFQIVLAAGNETDQIHFQEWINGNGFEKEKRIVIEDFRIPAGIILAKEKTVYLTSLEIFSACLRNNVHARTRSDLEAAEKKIAEEQTHLADIDEGDYAVHLNYGICRFQGIKTVDSLTGPAESMQLEFADGQILYVPVSQAHLLTRYIGSRGTGIKLSKPGSARWLKNRAEAGVAARNLACEMLRMQAVRNASDGIKFPEDSLEQRLFEDSFPFELTPGQARAVNEIKHDMEQSKPMDRLLCGDVGYGKTEVALRAAFKCVQSGRQVAVLVPTTVLAQQHDQIFQERFAEYPYVVETLSRLKSQREKSIILKKLASGGIDVIIGTHALLGKEVAFKDLGLVIIDEEQRFGVEHKEKLKAVRTMVDVLTMTATPIPRTLHLSMSGLRDLSVIMTAPVKRLPVHTLVIRQDPQLIAMAISRELSRGGQVFYLFNRVKKIDEAAAKIKLLAPPKARIGIAHGQMPVNDLEDVMSRFVRGEIDILVCTTIIESGIDIPNANTIFIERADRFGLAELHQLRGRVGRWNRQAYAYLLVPPSGVMTSDALKRMSAIRRYTQLGAGFKLALQDLELRGAGNIIGAEQSGYVDTIGFHLYCQLLREAADSMQGVSNPGIPAAELNIDFLVFALSTIKGRLAASIPKEYIEDERLRLDVYRRLALMPDIPALDDFELELRDRFGKIPLPTVHYLKAVRLKLMIWHAGWKSLSCIDGKIYLEKQGVLWRDPRGRIPHLPDMAPEQKLSMLFAFVKSVTKE